MRALIVLHKAATITPTTTAVLGWLWRSPFPGPIKLHTSTTSSRVVTHELDIGILMQVWVGVEFSDYQILYLFRSRREDVCQTGDLRVDRTCRRVFATSRRAIWLTLLSKDECEIEIQIVNVCKTDEEGRGRATGYAFWILDFCISLAISS